METLTLSCTNEDCFWEEDNVYENRYEAEQDAEASWCPECDSPLKVV